MRYALSAVLGVAILMSPAACDSPAPTTPAPKPAPLDLHWGALVRDHSTASAYVGRRIRVRLDRADYLCEAVNGVVAVRVWAGDRAAPPVLMFLCDSMPDGHITIVGVCREPVRDGRWRSPRVDYCVTVEDCIWTAR